MGGAYLTYVWAYLGSASPEHSASPNTHLTYVWAHLGSASTATLT